MAATYVYIDGFNLYHGINELDKPHLKWLCLRTLANSFVSATDTIQSIVYFTAISTWDRAKADRHREYIAALEATGVEIVTSRFLPQRKFCHEKQRYCKFKEEKQTDVALALRVMADVHSGGPDAVILVTADSDQIPLIRHVRDISPTTKITIAAPPNRLRQARELVSLADDHKKIKPSRLGACLLPQNVSDAQGRIVARRPAAYLRP